MDTGRHRTENWVQLFVFRSCQQCLKSQLTSKTSLKFANIGRFEEILSRRSISSVEWNRSTGSTVQSWLYSTWGDAHHCKVKASKCSRYIGQGIPIFTSGYPWWLPFRTHVEVTSTQIKTNALKMTLLWILVRLHGIENANMSRRTGFNVVVQNKVQVSKECVRYLPIIVILATDMSTMFEVHRQSLKIGTISSFTPTTSFLIASSTLR